MCVSHSIDSEKIASVDFFRDILQVFAPVVCQDDIALFLERVQVADDAAVEEQVIFHARFVDDELDALCLQPLHDPLNGGLHEIVGSGLHRQAVATGYSAVCVKSNMPAMSPFPQNEDELQADLFC